LSPVRPSAHLCIETSSPSAGLVRVAVTGEIDLATAGEFYAALFGVLSTRLPARVDVDLAGVTFMDCTGLTVLVLVRRAASRIGCQLRVGDTQPIVRRVLELTGLLGVLTAAFAPAPLAPAGPASAASVAPDPAAVTQLSSWPAAA
jgi:anti-anti-sigma factor